MRRPPPNWSRPLLKRVEKPGILNCLTENEPSSFVSDMTKTSTSSIISLASRSNLVHIELMFK